MTITEEKSVIIVLKGFRTAQGGRRSTIWKSTTFHFLPTVGRHRIGPGYTNRLRKAGLHVLFDTENNEIIVCDLKNTESFYKFHCEKAEDVIFIGHTFVTASHNGTVRIWSVETFECLLTFRNIPGLEVLGCDFRNLHPNSKPSYEGKQLLWEYGARFNDEDTRPFSS